MNNSSPRNPPKLSKQRKLKRDEAQTNSPSPSVFPTSRSASPSIPSSLNAADRPPSALPISHNSFQGGSRSISPKLRPATSRAQTPSRHRLDPGDSSRWQPSVAQISTALQGINVFALPHSNPVTPNAFSHRNYRSALDNLIHRQPSAAPTIARSQGTTEYVLPPLLINLSDLSSPSNRSTVACQCASGLFRSPQRATGGLPACPAVHKPSHE